MTDVPLLQADGTPSDAAPAPAQASGPGRDTTARAVEGRNTSIMGANGAAQAVTSPTAAPEPFDCPPSEYESKLTQQAQEHRAKSLAEKQQRYDNAVARGSSAQPPQGWSGPPADPYGAKQDLDRAKEAPLSHWVDGLGDKGRMNAIAAFRENMTQLAAAGDKDAFDAQCKQLQAIDENSTAHGVLGLLDEAVQTVGPAAAGAIGGPGTARAPAAGRMPSYLRPQTGTGAYPRATEAPSPDTQPRPGTGSTSAPGRTTTPRNGVAVRNEDEDNGNKASSQAPACRADPVDVTRGEYVEAWRDFSLDGTIPVEVMRCYGALWDTHGPLGRNRTCCFDVTFTVTPDNKLLFRDEAGRRVWFDRPFNFLPSTNRKYRHLSLRAPWLKKLELRDRDLTHHFDQGKDRVYRLTRTEDRHGNSLAFTRDAKGLLTEVRHSDGYTLVCDNDAQGLRRSVTRTAPGAPSLCLVSYSYDAAGNMLGAECATSESIFYAYDERNRLVEWRDGKLTRVRQHYDNESRVVLTASTGWFDGSRFEYDRANRITTFRPGGEAWERFLYDEDENVLEVTNALGEVIRYTYEDGYRTSETDGAGNATAYAYDAGGNVTSVRDPAGRLTRFRWDIHGQVDLVIDPAGHAYAYERDDRGNLVLARDPSGAVTRYAWTSAGRLAGITHPDGAQEHYVYDAQHRLMEHRAPNGALTRFERDAVGRVMTVTDAQGAVTRLAYEAQGSKAFWEPTRIEQPDGTTIRRSYDGEGMVASHTDGEGRTTTYHHGPFDELRAVVDPKGGVLQLAYDVAGQLVRVTNAHGLTYTFERDPAGRVVTETDFDGRVLRYGRDKAGRVTSRHAPDGSRRDFRYDPSGRLLTVEAYEPDGAGGTRPVPGETESFGYDARGLMSSARNTATEVVFERDSLGRVVSESQNHRRVASAYDARGRRTERAIGFAAGWGPGGQQAVGFGGFRPEDLQAGRIVTPINAQPSPAGAPDGVTRYAYDPLGALSELSLGVDVAGTAAEVVRFTRDSLGREVERSNGQGFVLEQAHDALGRLVRQRVAGRIPLLHHAAFGAASQPARPGQGGYTRTYAYDRTSSPTAISDDLWGATCYGYDANGQVTEARHGETGPGLPPARLRPAPPGGSLGLGDDSVEVERFAYDAAKDIAASDTAGPGEPLGRGLTAWLSSPGGRVRAARGPGGERILLTHDANGRVVERRVERDGFRPRTWRYRWDALDRMVGCTTPDGEGWAYAYDPFGRRVEKRQQADKWRAGTAMERAVSGQGHAVRGGSGAPAGTRFTWDGDVIAEEMPIGPDGTLAATKRGTWHFAPGSFVPLVREATDGTVQHVITDHLGTPRELVSARGDVVWAAGHRLWGGVRARWRKPQALPRLAANTIVGLSETDGDAGDDGHGDRCPIRFQGQWEDSETELCYNRFRTYDPLAGAYLTPDPLGLQGGTRPAGYVDCPTSGMDPFGLQVVPNGNRGVLFGPNDLYPGPGANTVTIQMTGARGTDFTAANRAAGITGGTPDNYTWHHANDYNPATGTTTMQLVDKDVHAGVGHDGSVKQFEQATGTEYDTPAARQAARKIRACCVVSPGSLSRH